MRVIAADSFISFGGKRTICLLKHFRQRWFHIHSMAARSHDRSRGVPRGAAQSYPMHLGGEHVWIFSFEILVVESVYRAIVTFFVLWVIIIGADDNLPVWL